MNRIEKLTIMLNKSFKEFKTSKTYTVENDRINKNPVHNKVYGKPINDFLISEDLFEQLKKY